MIKAIVGSRPGASTEGNHVPYFMLLHAKKAQLNTNMLIFSMAKTFSMNEKKHSINSYTEAIVQKSTLKVHW